MSHYARKTSTTRRNDQTCSRSLWQDAQGFQIDYDDDKGLYTMSKNEARALQVPLKSTCSLWMFTAHNEFLPGEKSPLVPEVTVNYAIPEDVVDLQCWHKRLGHLCPQNIGKMADDGLVEGMMLRRRQFNKCEAFQVGKHRAKSSLKRLERDVKERNELVFADLQFPSTNYNFTGSRRF